MGVSVLQANGKVVVRTSVYTWEWESATDHFRLLDADDLCIAEGPHRPGVEMRTPAGELLTPSWREGVATLKGAMVGIHYAEANGSGGVTVPWSFQEEHILLDPLRCENPAGNALVQITYFPKMYSRYAVVPGLCMSTNVSPVVDLHSELSVEACLGAGAMRGPGLTQQWGLPAHYFCLFNTWPHWCAMGAKKKMSRAACWGLRALPQGDFRLRIKEISASPVCNIRSDLWGHFSALGTLEAGFAFVITFGENYYEATRQYYRTLRSCGEIPFKTLSEKKRGVLLAPQYNTWGVEVAQALRPDELNETLLESIYGAFRASGMKAGTFVVDDKWESTYGELRHDDVRFPGFEAFLQKVRDDGYHVGLWAAFLRCQEPAALGLEESHLLSKPDGTPLWLSHGASRYGIFDTTQEAVQRVLAQKAREFVQRYRPDLIKFDFGYELPSLDVAAPANKEWAGERLIKKGLEVVVGAMREVNPDLVVMYYGLSPLLVNFYDLHSPDDLVYCNGDYDRESNRRLFFSSLCGEIGMPTYSSSGYDWASASDIWFDAIASGTVGSLHCFDGDENDDTPRLQDMALYNGLGALVRSSSEFSVFPLDAHFGGGLRAAFSSSWERMENGKSVLVALRTTGLHGKPGLVAHKDILDTDMSVVVASRDENDIANAASLGIVPLGAGQVVVRHLGSSRVAHVTEHLWGGGTRKMNVAVNEGRCALILNCVRERIPVEWVEVVFE